MVEKLYNSDPYLKKFDAKVESIKGDRIFLNRTAFYPGGGGQQHDLGTINGTQVKETGIENGEIYHLVRGASFKAGQEVHCVLDWPRRYDLMKGHTGQHILFRSIQEINPELKVVKVDIAADRKSVFLDGEVSWEILKRAITRANEIISSDLDIIIKEVPIYSDELEQIRIKKDKIKGDSVRVVKIGDFDLAACGGVHVRKSGEIGGICIYRLISGRQASDWEIQFNIGPKAVLSSARLAISALSVADKLGCAVENIEPTVTNIIEREKNLAEHLNVASLKQLETLQPETIGSYYLYSLISQGTDQKLLSDTASKLIRKEGTIVLFCDISEGAYLLLGCNEDIDLDCEAFLRKGLRLIAGRGGGKKNFAMGGSSDASKAKEAFNLVRDSIIHLYGPK